MRVWNRMFAIGLVSAMGCGAWLSASNAADSFEDIGSGSTNNSWGVGTALSTGRRGSVHYDHASLDREIGGHLKPNSGSVQVDPMAIVEDLR